MSGKTARARRSDAEANTTRIRTAALALLDRGSDPSMAEIAAAAGLSRQTLYSHFPDRQALYDVLVADLVMEAAATLDAGSLPADPADGLAEWLARAWRLIDARPALLNAALFANTSARPGSDPVSEHEPILSGLRRILTTAAEQGVLTEDASPDWLVSAVIALGHAAGQEVTAGRMSRDDAGAAFRSGALRLCLDR